MSISPQAAYLSTIIPNAVLPASVEVIEIDRRSNRTHGNSTKHGRSVCAVSKTSLTSVDSSASPLLSRRSETEGSQTDNSQDSTTSISGSNWSKSESSKTLFSNSSPLAPGMTLGDNSPKEQQNGQEGRREQQTGDQDLVTLDSSFSMVSSHSSGGKNVTDQGSESGLSGSGAAAEDEKTKQNFARSLSVIKTKQPPAPPQRTNSLHNNKIRCNGRILVESTMVNGAVSGEVTNGTHALGAKDKTETSTIPTKSNGSCLADVSSSLVSPTPSSCNEGGGASQSTNSPPQKTHPEEGKFERTISPSSGYSSQSGTPTLSPKGISPVSPDKQKKKPVKPERSVSRASSSAASPSSSLTSLSSNTSEPINQDVSRCSPSLPPKGLQQTAAAATDIPANTISPTLTDVKELLDIPPPPKVKAPCPPPPEVWTHNRRCFDLLCGPSPNLSTAPQKPAKTLDIAVKQAETQTENNEKMHISVSKPVPAEACASSQLLELNVRRSTTDPAGFHKELDQKGFPAAEQKVEACVQTQEQTKEPAKPEMFPKKGPPPVMKKPNLAWRREDVISTELSAEKREVSKGAAAGVVIPTETQATSSQAGMTAPDKSEAASNQALPTQGPPPHAPPPVTQSPPPPTTQTPPPSVSALAAELQDVQEDIHVADSSWPPPPPPLEGDSVFDGGDEVDFPPPPPPPFMSDREPNITDYTIPDLNGPEEPTECCNHGSNEAERPINDHIPDLPAVAPERIADSRPEDVLACSKGDAEDEISSRCLQIMSVPDRDAPPTVKLTPVVKAENSGSVSTSVPPNLVPDCKDHENQTPSEPPVSSQILDSAPIAPPLPAENLTHGVTFRRQPSVTNRDARSKELLCRHKSAPIPKEDANIPLVTPSLLQMVRLRSVSMAEEQIKAPAEDKSTIWGDAVTENNPDAVPGPQSTPQKPIRKSLSLKSPQLSGKAPTVTLNTPSMRLQEAIRMKTAAMSSRDGLPPLLGVRSSTQGCSSEQGAQSLKLPEGYDLHKSPASTASFIFSRSTKKVVIEPAASSSPEAQASLKQSLAAELMQRSDQSKVISNGRLKSDKVPPPVARKPSHGGIGSSPTHRAYSAKEHETDGVIQRSRAMTSPESTSKQQFSTVVLAGVMLCIGVFQHSAAECERSWRPIW